MNRLLCRLRYRWYGLLAWLCHVEAARSHERRALANERHFRRLECRCVGKQAQALKGLLHSPANVA